MFLHYYLKEGRGSGFASRKTVLTVPVPLSVPGKASFDCSGFRFRFGFPAPS